MNARRLRQISEAMDPGVSRNQVMWITFQILFRNWVLPTHSLMAAGFGQAW
jgi:hypothetical protein